MAETDRLVERLTEWANDYPPYLHKNQQDTDYAKGYKEGIVICKEIIKGFLNECGFGTIIVNKENELPF